MTRYKTVLFGKDNEALSILLEVHAVSDPLILDCTHNKGTMWRDTAYKPVRMDVNPSFSLDVCGDFLRMPFADDTFDVIVFDPPFLPTSAASANSSRIWETRYGITSSSPLRDGDNVSPIFAPFLSQAKRILKNNGIILAKISDIVHNHKQQFQAFDFIYRVKESGMCPCDMLIKVDPVAGNLKSSKWKNVRHLRKSHCYFIVVRKGGCERR